MHRTAEDNPAVAAFLQSARETRGRWPILGVIYGQLAEIERRVDRLECNAGLRRYLSAGYRVH